MSNDKNKLVPELRFPGFANDGEWEEKVLSKITDAIFDGTHQTPTYVEHGIPFFSVENIVSGNKNKFISKKDYELATSKNKPKKGDILITRIGKIGFSTIVDWDYEFSIYVTLACIKCSKKINSYYLHSYFQSNIYQKEILSKSLLNAVPCKINMNELRETKVLLPKSQEQEKIAFCLYSLDELITAQSNKLEVLKNHKKGLMQNLFPQGGQKVPNYRFAEFKNVGEWKETTIGLVAKVTTGNKDTQNKIDDGKYPFFVRSQTVERINSYSFEGEAILTSGDGVGVGKNFHYINGKFDYHQRVYCIYDFAEEVSGMFVFMYFSQYFDERVMRMSAKNSVDSVRMAMITEMPISLPSKKEQQKIADCLSSLGELINAQTAKIEQLQLHKKGLMQVLFPHFNEK
jgi:type I restriction enzyme S subunit